MTQKVTNKNPAANINWSGANRRAIIEQVRNRILSRVTVSLKANIIKAEKYNSDPAKRNSEYNFISRTGKELLAQKLDDLGLTRARVDGKKYFSDKKGRFNITIMMKACFPFLKEIESAKPVIPNEPTPEPGQVMIPPSPTKSMLPITSPVCPEKDTGIVPLEEIITLPQSDRVPALLTSPPLGVPSSPASGAHSSLPATAEPSSILQYQSDYKLLVENGAGHGGAMKNLLLRFYADYQKNWKTARTYKRELSETELSAVFLDLVINRKKTQLDLETGLRNLKTFGPLDVNNVWTNRFSLPLVMKYGMGVFPDLFGKSCEDYLRAKFPISAFF
jgi:hypothetical protein